MTSNGSKSELDLGTLLDTYGVDTARWPEHMRARADMLLAQEPRAGHMLAEAKALDALLAHAPVPAAARHAALTERIVAAAQDASAREVRTGQVMPSGIVLPWPGVARGRNARAFGRSHASVWSAGALLAASLAVGLFVGALDLAPGAVNQLVQSVTLDDDTEQAVAAIGNDSLAAALDEDLL